VDHLYWRGERRRLPAAGARHCRAAMPQAHQQSVASGRRLQTSKKTRGGHHAF